jgi:class 3 adenylate cyclase
MSETRKIAAILVADVVGYSRLTGADEECTLARLRALRSDLLDPAVTVHHGHLVKRTGDGVSSSFAALSTLCAAPSKCKTGWSSATLVCRLTVASVPHWRPSGRCRRGGRRGPHGRWRQYRRAA